MNNAEAKKILENGNWWHLLPESASCSSVQNEDMRKLHAALDIAIAAINNQEAENNAHCKNKRKLRKTIAIDFDGCLCSDAYPKVGDPNWNVIDRAIFEQGRGAGLILWTCREGKLLMDAIRACEAWGVHFDAVNESLPDWIEAYGSAPRKVGASEYWDDKAAVMPCSSEAQQQYVRGYDAGYAVCESEMRKQLSAMQQKVEALQKVPDKLQGVSLKDMGFSTRAYNALWRNDIETSEDLAGLTYEGLKRRPHVGEKVISEIISRMRELGYDVSAMLPPDEKQKGEHHEE